MSLLRKEKGGSYKKATLPNTHATKNIASKHASRRFPRCLQPNTVIVRGRKIFTCDYRITGNTSQEYNPTASEALLLTLGPP